MEAAGARRACFASFPWSSLPSLHYTKSCLLHPRDPLAPFTMVKAAADVKKA